MSRQSLFTIIHSRISFPRNLGFYVIVGIVLITPKMADGFDDNDDDSRKVSSNDDDDYLEKPMPKQLTSLFGNIIVSGASKAAGAVESSASYIAAPIISPPNVWPDMDNIDNLVNVLTITGYTFAAFSTIGATYFLARTVREFWQWKSWYRRSHVITARRLHRKT